MVGSPVTFHPLVHSSSMAIKSQTSHLGPQHNSLRKNQKRCTVDISFQSLHPRTRGKFFPPNQSRIFMKVLATQSSWTLCSSMDCGSLGSSVHEISQARILERVAIPFSRGSSQPKDRIHVSCIAGRFFTVWATRGSQDFHEKQLNAKQGSESFRKG